MAAGTSPPFKVTFKYEKLRNFFYRCGFRNHVDRFCELEAREPLPYGIWMRADQGRDNGKGIEGSHEEVVMGFRGGMRGTLNKRRRLGLMIMGA